MNIFKILASGHGSISETNISAFLGYLLNPNEDHGLGSFFLRKILNEHLKANPEINLAKSLLNEKKQIRDLSISSDFRIEVFLEQAFQRENKHEIVDIVILISKIKSPATHSTFLKAISEKKTLESVILIEIKKHQNASNKGKTVNGDDINQLLEQFKNTKSELEKFIGKSSSLEINENSLENISLIYLTPKSKNFLDDRITPESVFAQFMDDSSLAAYAKSHLYWKTEDEYSISELIDKFPNKTFQYKNIFQEEFDFACNEEVEEYDDASHRNEEWMEWFQIKSERENIKSIETLIDSILTPMPDEKSEIIPNYTTETLQSFSNFIYSDFKSKIKEKDLNRDSGKKIFSSLRELWQVGNCSISENERHRVDEIYASPSFKECYPQNKFNKTHILKFFKNGKILFRLSSRSKCVVFNLQEGLLNEKVLHKFEKDKYERYGKRRNEFYLGERSSAEILQMIDFLYHQNI